MHDDKPGFVPVKRIVPPDEPEGAVLRLLRELRDEIREIRKTAERAERIEACRRAGEEAWPHGLPEPIKTLTLRQDLSDWRMWGQN